MAVASFRWQVIIAWYFIACPHKRLLVNIHLMRCSTTIPFNLQKCQLCNNAQCWRVIRVGAQFHALNRLNFDIWLFKLTEALLLAWKERKLWFVQLHSRWFANAICQIIIYSNISILCQFGCLQNPPSLHMYKAFFKKMYFFLSPIQVEKCTFWRILL